MAGTLRHVIAAAAPDRVTDLVALDDAMRAPLPLSTRIGVVGTSAGAGCSVLAGLVAATLAARRPGRVLAVNASSAGRSVLWYGGCSGAATATPEQHTARLAAQTGEQAIDGLVRTPSGLYCLDLADDGGTVPDRRWWEAVGPAGRFFDVVVTDLGARTIQQSGPVGAASSVVCVVAEAQRSAWQHAVDLAASFVSAGLPAVLGISAVREPARAWAAAAARRSPVPAVVLPHDRAHGAATLVSSRQLRPATTHAALRLAAALVSAAAPMAGSAAS